MPIKPLKNNSNSKKNNMTVDQKFAKALFKLRELRPFYSAIYESIPHIETNSIDTMAVTSKELLYNVEFVDKLSFNELMFVIMHEINHIALMHVPRLLNKDSRLWNIACDLYDNKILSEEFGIQPGETCKKEPITFPLSALYYAEIDIHLDYAEDLYRQLDEQADKNGYYKFMQSRHSESDHGEFGFSVQSRGGKGQFKFKVDTSVTQGDLMLSGLDEQEEINNTKRLLADAKTKYDMGKKPGASRGFLEIAVDELLRSHIDWRKLLRKYCLQMTRSDSTYSMPDKRMFYQKAIYPGQTMEQANILKGVKICFDSSGSISLEDMRHFYGQVYQLLKTFKVEAEVLFWDTDIEKKGELSKALQITRLTGRGGGGTDPDCLFKYFDSYECKVKPYVTLIFTDGYIGGSQDGKGWKRKYKNTIWVMTRNYDKRFEPKFGTLAIANFDNKK